LSLPLRGRQRQRHSPAARSPNGASRSRYTDGSIQRIKPPVRSRSLDMGDPEGPDWQAKLAWAYPSGNGPPRGCPHTSSDRRERAVQSSSPRAAEGRPCATKSPAPKKGNHRFMQMVNSYHRWQYVSGRGPLASAGASAAEAKEMLSVKTSEPSVPLWFIIFCVSALRLRT